jgi:acyl carrier protein
MTGLMNATETIDEIVREILRGRASGLAVGEELPDDLLLGAEGLGLDSIALAELLLDCQQRFGVSVVALLEGEPLTLGRLVAYLERETRT